MSNLGDNIRYYIWDKPHIDLKYDILETVMFTSHGVSYGVDVKINIESSRNDVLLIGALLFEQNDR